MCEALDVSVSGYHAWAARPDSPTEQWRQELVAAIEEIHAQVKGRYGSPRMTAELNARGYECSENTVAELMWEHGIRARTPKRFVRTTDSNHRLPVTGNVLERRFDPEEPNVRWCADITYLPTREGWLYLAAASIRPRSVIAENAQCTTFDAAKRMVRVCERLRTITTLAPSPVGKDMSKRIADL